MSDMQRPSVSTPGALVERGRAWGSANLDHTFGADRTPGGPARLMLDLADALEAASTDTAALQRVRALCDRAERNYGGPTNMANLEAWVHLGSLRAALDTTKEDGA